MSSQLLIQDLSYLRDASESGAIVAGYVFVYTGTNAGSGYADAGALAYASGQQTATNTQTKALTQYYGSFTYSQADSLASAYAKTGTSSERAWSTSTSLSFSST